MSSLYAGHLASVVQENIDKSKAEYIFSLQRALECQRTSDYCVSKHQLTYSKNFDREIIEPFLINKSSSPQIIPTQG